MRIRSKYTHSCSTRTFIRPSRHLHGIYTLALQHTCAGRAKENRRAPRALESPSTAINATQKGTHEREDLLPDDRPPQPISRRTAPRRTPPRQSSVVTAFWWLCELSVLRFRHLAFDGQEDGLDTAAPIPLHFDRVRIECAISFLRSERRERERGERDVSATSSQGGICCGGTYDKRIVDLRLEFDGRDLVGIVIAATD